jgi:hypothetical protein
MFGRGCRTEPCSVSFQLVFGCMVKLICQIPSQLYLTQTSERSSIPQATSENHQTSTIPPFTDHHPVLSASPHLRDQGLRLESTFLDSQERSWSWTYSHPRNVYRLPKLLKPLDSRRMKLLEDPLLPKHQYVILSVTLNMEAYVQILARNFVWLADSQVLDHFYSQILPHVPSHAPKTADGNGGGSVRGINARFRVYQYRENQVYRVSYAFRSSR